MVEHGTTGHTGVQIGDVMETREQHIERTAREKLRGKWSVYLAPIDPSADAELFNVKAEKMRVIDGALVFFDAPDRSFLTIAPGSWLGVLRMDQDENTTGAFELMSAVARRAVAESRVH